MRLKNVVLSSVAGMCLSSATVYSFTPAPAPSPAAVELAPGAEAAEVAGVPSSFTAGAALRVEGRVGHPRLLKGSAGVTYALLEVRGDDAASATRAASHLALVIDRSGSMKGDRIRNAILSAKAAVDRLGEGDTISVITFDTRPALVVPATAIDAASRERVKAAIESIKLGGDTCISCGVDEGVRELVQSSGKVDRMIVLSDGDATDGVRDVVGLRRIARRAHDQGVTISTIGVGLNYNQAILGAIALEAGGGHHFVEDAGGLDRALATEADALRSTVAVNAEAVIEPGPGVEIEQVMDRAFDRRGDRVAVPLGSFAKGEVKTVLARVRVPTRAEGPADLGVVRLRYRDPGRGEEGLVEGALGVRVAADGPSDLDALVAGRLARSGTADALLRANELVAEGKFEEANRVLADQQRLLNEAATRARSAAPAPRAADVRRDFEGQASALESANRGLQKAAPKPAVERARRASQELANPFMR